MATGNEQLLADFNKLKATLQRYPDIEILRTEGEPPELYEIEYRIRGYAKDSSGGVDISGRHRISLELPFGYPYFAPTVKPTSPIFHPDIDPDAIRIAGFWQEHQSLDALILHIGEMICGVHYSTEDPFNQAAADWFVAHAAELPLDRLNTAEVPEENFSDFDILGDDTFAALRLEGADETEVAPVEAPLEEMEEFAPEAETGDLMDPEQLTEQLRSIRMHLEQGKVFEASRCLAGLPEGIASAEHNELATAVTTAIQESNKLHRKATDLEQQGKYEEALRLLDALSKKAGDHPSLLNARKRIQNSLELTSSLDKSIAKSPGSEKKEAAPSSDKKKELSAKTKKERPRVTPPSVGSTFSYKPIAAGAMLLLVLGGGGMLYLKDSATVKDARNNLQQAKDLSAKEQFADAEQAAKQGLQNAESILLLRGTKESLRTDINNLLQAKAFQEGLAGRVAYEGRFIDKALALTLTELQKQSDAAKQLRTDGKKEAALERYTAALSFAEKNQLTEQADQLKITIAALRLETTIGKAQAAEADNEWANAAKTYEQALQIAKAMADKGGEQEIARKLAAATFRHEMDQSKNAFTEAQWKDTIEMLERARKVQAENPEVVTETEKQELERLLMSSKLYQGLTVARNAYEQGNPEKAIADYQAVLALLRDNTTSFGGRDAIEPSSIRIEKTIFAIRLNQLRQKAIGAEQQKELEGAVGHYREINRLINSSPFAHDDDIKELSALAKEKTGVLEHQMVINNQIAWLKNNYQDIFRKHYPATGGSVLQNPKISLLEEKNGKFLYSLSCVERNQGSAFQLQLNYQYDPATKHWTMVADQ